MWQYLNKHPLQKYRQQHIHMKTIRFFCKLIVKDEPAAHEAAIKELINSNMKSTNEQLGKLSTETAELTKSL